MNPFFLLIGILFVIIMLLFGNNPLEKAREEKAKRGGDPLVNAIEDYNTKSRQGFGGSKGFGNAQGSIAPTMNPLQPGTPLQNLQGATPNPYPGSSPYGQTKPAQPTEEYYPPPPMPNSNGGIGPGRVGPQSFLQKPGSSTVYLRTGQPVSFSGVNVYAVGAEGTLIPMPDGQYAMYDGKINMTVKNGRRIMTLTY